VELLRVGTTGSALAVSATVQETLAPGEPWYDVAIGATAYPFSGTLTATFTATDLALWADGLEALTDGVGRVVLGGDRAAELVVVAEETGPGERVLEVSLVPSGDDPWPQLRWLVFDVPADWAAGTAARVRTLA
jgi:hypothetical protein